MTDSISEFAQENGLGAILDRVRLDGTLLLADGARERAALLLTGTGLWLLAARDRFHGRHVDLLTRADLRLESGRVRDRLTFGTETLSIPAGRRAAVERLIALARLASHGSNSLGLKASRLVHEPDELGKAWLERELQPREVLVCWLRGSNRTPVASRIAPDSAATPYLFVTERRAAVVAWSAVGDVTYGALVPEHTSLNARGEKAELSCVGAVFLSRRSDAPAARDAFELLLLSEPKARLFEAARRLWHGSERDRNAKARVFDLLHGAIEHGSARARFARLLLTAEAGEGPARVDRGELTRALELARVSPEALAELWAAWAFSSEAGGALVRGLLGGERTAFPWALALERRMHPAPPVGERAARTELELCQFDAEQRSASDPRASALRQALAPGGLLQPSLVPVPPSLALAPALFETRLQHPLARKHHALGVDLQKLVALAPTPDFVALNDYCEALREREHPSPARALAAARLAFGLPGLEVYVSRGKKSVGLRGYEAPTPYVLLGSSHLDPSSPYFMAEAELFFAFGAEALHLKLGQARVTSSEVWAGAFAHTRGGVELALGFLPLLKAVPINATVTRVLERVPEPALKRGIDALLRFERSVRKPDPELPAAPALSLINEDLVVAHRLMQMSADRAGLSLCGAIAPALRGLLLVRPDYRSLLREIETRDLVSVLLDESRTSAMHRDLVVRVAALLSFYLSDDFEAVRQGLLGQPASELGADSRQSADAAEH